MCNRIKARALTRAAWCAALLATMIAQPAHAGPPYLTDDPEPTDPQHWEIYNFVTGEREPGGSSVDLGEDINYGAARDLQLTMVLPLHQETGVPLDPGDVELGAKYRFWHQQPATLSFDASFFPTVILPTGRGAHRAQLLLPLWLQKDFGSWSVFGGGGYTLNPGRGNRNFAALGVVVARTVLPGWQLGMELNRAGAVVIGDRGVTVLNFGSTVHIKGPFSWLASFGQGLDRRQTVFYTSLKLDL